jgi:glycosyltransferase involved in cell wall biosynthesis
MRILLSAYACDPFQGSEPRVGWNWALTLAAAGHEVCVITRESNRPSVERYLSTRSIHNLQFIYLPLSKWCSLLLARPFLQTSLGYLDWQLNGRREIQRIADTFGPDIVQHVTYATLKAPSFLAKLKLPFVFGPVGGGERRPPSLWRYEPWRARVMAAIRDAANLTIKFNPLMWQTFSRASRILVTSEQTRQLVPRRFRAKTAVRLAIALAEPANLPVAPRSLVRGRPFRLAFAGRLLSWKGLSLALDAFARLVRENEHVRFTIVGSGPDESRLRKLSRQLRIDHLVVWHPWLPPSEMEIVYHEHDALLFPSFHDSGGFVVLEALSHGLPVVCLDVEDRD